MEMPSLMREFKAWGWKDRLHVIKTGLAPYEYVSENISLWIKIITYVLIVGIPSFAIFNVLLHTPKLEFVLLLCYTFGVIFSIFHWCIMVPLINAIKFRIWEEREKMRHQMEQMLEMQKDAMIQNLRDVSGRQDLQVDPISIVAATIETTDKLRSTVNPAENPLRAALDGTLRPEHLQPPEDETFDGTSE